jgi:F0F1-type ATP synthase membrane subunit b/b'
VLVLIKVAYKRSSNVLQKNVDDIRISIENLEQKKIETENLIEQMTKSINTINANIEKAITTAEIEAAKITKKSTEEIDEIVKKKQHEYDIAASKIRASLSIELQNKIVNLTIKRMMQKLSEDKSNYDMQSRNMEISAKMIEELVDQYSNRN